MLPQRRHTLDNGNNKNKHTNGIDTFRKLKPPLAREFGREISNLNQKRVLRKAESYKTFNMDKLMYNLRPRTLNMNKSNQITNLSFIQNENSNTMNTDKMDVDEDIQINTNRSNKSNDSNLLSKHETSSKKVKKENESTFRSLIGSGGKSSRMNNSFLCVNINPQVVKEYLEDIYDHCKTMEKEHQADFNYMQRQVDVNDKMRSILIDWLVDVHLKFKLLPETLFLTVNLLDRFLSRNNLNRTRLQLLGVSALFIACKYEEIYPPELKDFIYVTDKAYSKSEMLKMENDILSNLNFDVTTPSSLRFLEFYFELLEIRIDDHLFMFARYLLELSLVEYKMLRYPPSRLAAAALYVSLRHRKINKKMEISKASGYTEEKLKECARDLCLILDKAEISSLQAVRNKFSSGKCFEVAKWKK